MPTEFAFRLSTYLTLAMSCLCLGYAEWDLLKESTVIMVAVLVSLGFSFWANGRYLLDLKAANRVGLVIGILVGGWMTYQFINENSVMRLLPMPAGLLPYLGPLLMILMPAKLFRPKHVGDWWAMQGIALAGACLASAMADDEIFGLLLGFYAVAGVASLALFYYRRTANTLPPVPNTDAGPPTEIVSSFGGASPASGRSIVRRVVGWLGVAALVALPLFFLTPRSQSPKWSFGKGRLETGFTGDQSVDLTRTGTLEINREIAFHVDVFYDAQKSKPKLDLSPNQRGRGLAFTNYEHGRWTRADPPSLYVNGAIALPANAAVPLNLGPDRVVLDYEPRVRMVEPVLADPVVWDVDKPPPVISVLSTGERRSWWVQKTDGSFRPSDFNMPNRSFRYQQINRIPSGVDPDLGPPFERAGAQPGTGDPFAVYRYTKLAKLRSWTRELLVRLAKTDPRLQGVLERATDRVVLEVAERDYEAVARSFNDFLKTSGEYEYTLKLRRTDKSLDPIEDFLMKTKTGHCERFAASLVLMLRSVGVPAAYVIGFKGCDNQGDGSYVIRQEHAHGWVEVLVPRPAPPGFPFAPRSENSPPATTTWHWLSLDPTPDTAEVENSDSLTGWLGSAKDSSIAFFLDFIVGYNSDRRGQTVDAFQEWASENLVWLLAIPAIVAVLVFGRRIVRRLRPVRPPSHGLGDGATGVDWFDRYLVVLKRFEFRPAIGATPAEYAVAVAEVLRTHPGRAEHSETPLRVTKAFYLVRYAKQTPTDAERTHLIESIAQLAEALRKGR